MTAERTDPRDGGFALEDVPLVAILDASPNAIVAVDERGAIVYVNASAEATFGYARSELVGEPIEILLPARLHAAHLANRRDFLANPVARPMGIGLDLAARRRDGSLFPVEISLAPVRVPGGVRVFATVVDITARKAAENQLLQSQKLESIGRLAGGIAHDFNNMMFAIRGYAELLSEDLTEPDPGAFDAVQALQYVHSIAQAADRASELTAQLLAFSRRQVVTPRVLEMNTAAGAIESLVRPLIGEHIHLTFRLDPEAGSIHADPGQLDQIIVNLVVNARDALPGGGTITIETAGVEFDEAYALRHGELEPGAYVQLAVSDNGVGMDAETREHIFEPFFTTKELGKGTGLGLATIYGIVRQAGGHIIVYSEPGIGSTFKLYFPRVDASAEATVAPAAPLALGTGRILVVEDEAFVREVTKRLLQRAGYEAIAVPDSQEGLAIVANDPEFDVVVSDVIMPDGSGIDFVAEVMDRHPRVGVVLLSGYTEETLDLARVTARGAVFLSKPASSASLLHAVQTAVAIRRGERSA